MNALIRNIQKSVSLRLSLSILTFVVLIFIVSMGFMVHRSRESIRQAAIEETRQMLYNTAQHLTGVMDEVEVATNNMDWQVMQNLNPDSLFALSARILSINSMLNGCSIAMEPYFFPSEGKYFSAYSFNNNGHIETENEGNDDYVYFDMDWYSVPMLKKKACWVDPFQDYNPSGIYSRYVIASYCKPLVTKEGRIIGVLSVDLTQRNLSQILLQEWRYPDSFFVLLGSDGNIIAAGKEDAKIEDLQRKDCLVLQQDLSESGWKLAIVCPEADIYKGYNKLVYLIISIIVFGLLLILALCYYIIHKTMDPVVALAQQTSEIAEGHFDRQIAPSTRTDEVGKLQNSFHQMQHSIANYVSDLEEVRSKTEQKNEELMVAKNMAEESDRKKTQFIQDMFHQIRTPLNIISGFAQVLRDGHSMISEEELDALTRDVQLNGQTISNIIDNWMKTLALEELKETTLTDHVSCNAICQEVANGILLRHPEAVELKVETMTDDVTLTTNKAYLVKILSELLHNANKYTQQGSIIIGYKPMGEHNVSFYVSDTGPGIPDEDQERVFTQFTKLNDFNEGLGMGLYLCKQIAGLLGGKLAVDSMYFGGTRMVLTLKV